MAVGEPRNVPVPRSPAGRGYTPARPQPRLDFVLPRIVPLDLARPELGTMIDPPARAPASDFVRFGMWNNAYTTTGTAATGVTPPRTLRNGDADDANFIGLDSRHFYVRITGVRPRGRTVRVTLETVNDDGSPCDVRTGDAAEITLIQGADPTTYVSRPLLLVNRERDLFVPTHPGTPGAPPQNRVYGESDHRVRMANMYGKVRAHYHGSPRLTREVQVFAPSERVQVTIEVFAFGPPGGPFTMAETSPLRSTQSNAGDPGQSPLVQYGLDQDLTAIQSVLSRIGVDPIVHQLHQITLPAQLTAGGAPTTLASVQSIDSATWRRMQANFPPSEPWMIRLFVVGSLDSSFNTPNGNAIGVSSSLNVGILPSQVAAFVEQRRRPYTSAHELVHLLGYPGHVPDTYWFHLMHTTLTADLGPDARNRLDAGTDERLRQVNATTGQGTGVFRPPPAGAGFNYRTRVTPPAGDLPRI